jgi:CspA family cold shock protein
LKGTIQKLIRDRGFGFIKSESGDEIFVHRSAFQNDDFDAVREGQSVEFNEERGPKGMRAANVRVTGDE